MPLEFGDCFIIQWTTNKNHHLLLDGGTSKLYKTLLCDQIKQMESIDLWAVSHVHDDHIGGVLKYIDGINGGVMPVKCERWLFNVYQDSLISDQDVAIDGSVAESVAQGNKLVAFLNKNGFTDTTVVNGDRIILDGLSIAIVTPLDCREPISEAVKEPSSAMSSLANDYATSIEDFDLSCFDEDSSSFNASSIAMIIDSDGSRFFWTADARPKELVRGLKELGYSDYEPLCCDYMSLPHHGSKGNLNMELISLVKCHKFFVTANGCNKHNLPNKEPLVRILCHPQRDYNQQIKFYFPLKSDPITGMFDVDGQDVFKKYNFKFCF